MGKQGKLTVLVCACAAPALLLLGTTPALAAYEVKSNDSSINDGTLGQRVGAACDDGVSVSGGAYNDASYADGVYLTEMLPLDPFASRHRSWTVGADNYPGGAPSNTFSVQVICDLQNGWNDYDRVERQNGLKVPDDKLGGATVKCPAGHPVVGGGYDESGFFDEEAYLSMSAPVDGKDADKVPDDGWRFEVNNDEDVDGKVVKGTVTAICDKRRPSSAYHYRTDQKNVQDASQGILSLGCSNSETLMSGGAEAKAPYNASMLLNSSSYLVVGDPNWFTAADNYATPDGKTRKLAAYAICRR